MIRLRLSVFSLLLALLVSCGPGTAPASTSVTAPGPTSIPHAPEIRFGLIGGVRNANVWALFDSAGYSYNDYAIRSDYWPRLYRLSIPDRQFIPLATSAAPSSFQQEGSFYTATVPLRTDLVWTDGTSFTADDVAFTANTVLSFQLGFDWHDAYNSAWLDHVDAVDAHTVKYYFKRQPNVGVWQYGVLQAPIVQKAFWTPGVMEAAASLPSDELAAQIDTLKVKVNELRKDVDALSQSFTSLSGEDARQAQIVLNHQKQNLDQAINSLDQAKSDFDDAMSSARTALYALSDNDEPSLGDWKPGTAQNGSIKNDANVQFPQAHLNFDHALFRLYPDEASALQGMSSGDVNAILAPGGLMSQDLARIPSSSLHLMMSSTHALRFLVFNPLTSVLRDSAMRQALACVIDQDQMVKKLGEAATPLRSYVLPQETLWYNADIQLPCQGLDVPARLTRAVQILKTAGYTWKHEPSGDQAGNGLALPNGNALPAIHLMVSASDSGRVAAATYVQQQAHKLGIPLAVQSVTLDAIDYAVFSSQRYDMALLGWSVSAYPGYLCDWFGDGNPFGYKESQLKTRCNALDSNADLAVSRKQVDEIQSVLIQELPFVPLYTDVTVDAYQGVAYPFMQVLDGLSGIYGGPSLAIPAAK